MYLVLREVAGDSLRTGSGARARFDHTQLVIPVINLFKRVAI
jgi:hypothetical protein